LRYDLLVRAAPSDDFVEQAWRRELAPDATGETHMAPINDRLKPGFEATTRNDQLLCLYEWQDFQSGHYALGSEPSTRHIVGEPFARQRGEMIWLAHDGERRFDALARARRRR